LTNPSLHSSHAHLQHLVRSQVAVLAWGECMDDVVSSVKWRHFGPRTLWTQDISVPGPNCPDISALVPNCLTYTSETKEDRQHWTKPWQGGWLCLR